MQDGEAVRGVYFYGLTIAGDGLPESYPASIAGCQFFVCIHLVVALLYFDGAVVEFPGLPQLARKCRCVALPNQVECMRPGTGPVNLLLHRPCVSLDEPNGVEIRVIKGMIDLRQRLLKNLFGFIETIEACKRKFQAPI